MPLRPMNVAALASAVAWFGTAAVIGPSLGWRGWIWLGLIGVIAVPAAAWELWPTRLDALWNRAGGPS